jgi:hypothetical protein
VINTKRDFELARREHWYRIPRDTAPRTIDVEYLAFFLSGPFKEQNHAIYYYAARTGHELVRRRDLLPDQPDHKRADKLYYKMQIGELQVKTPPITNPTHRSFAFIMTTWDRFVNARHIADLYSKADWFVERVTKALHEIGIMPDRRWQDEDPAQRVAELRIACHKGLVTATTGLAAVENVIQLSPGDSDSDVNAAAEAIRAAVEAMGGPAFVSLPPDE